MRTILSTSHDAGCPRHLVEVRVLVLQQLGGAPLLQHGAAVQHDDLESHVDVISSPLSERLTLSPVVTVWSLWAMVSTVQPLNSVRRVS